jgi:hypothetical protein
MCTHRFPDTPYIDPAPFPKNIPQVDELGVSSAPLKSASFFIGAHCKPYNGARSILHSYSVDGGNTDAVAFCPAAFPFDSVLSCIRWLTSYCSLRLIMHTNIYHPSTCNTKTTILRRIILTSLAIARSLDNRGLHAMQIRKQGSRTLLERRTTCDKMCERSVSVVVVLFQLCPCIGQCSIQGLLDP